MKVLVILGYFAGCVGTVTAMRPADDEPHYEYLTELTCRDARTEEVRRFREWLPARVMEAL